MIQIHIKHTKTIILIKHSKTTENKMKKMNSSATHKLNLHFHVLSTLYVFCKVFLYLYKSEQNF